VSYVPLIVSLQPRLAQVGGPAHLPHKDFTFRTNRPKNPVYTELRVKPEDFRRLCLRRIVVTELNIVNSETNVSPKKIGMTSQETLVSGNRVLIPS
jgi:hypothetical protein